MVQRFVAWILPESITDRYHSLLSSCCRPHTSETYVQRLQREGDNAQKLFACTQLLMCMPLVDWSYVFDQSVCCWLVPPSDASQRFPLLVQTLEYVLDKLPLENSISLTTAWHLHARILWLVSRPEMSSEAASKWLSVFGTRWGNSWCPPEKLELRQTDTKVVPTARSTAAERELLLTNFCSISGCVMVAYGSYTPGGAGDRAMRMTEPWCAGVHDRDLSPYQKLLDITLSSGNTYQSDAPNFAGDLEFIVVYSFQTWLHAEQSVAYSISDAARVMQLEQCHCKMIDFYLVFEFCGEVCDLLTELFVVFASGEHTMPPSISKLYQQLAGTVSSRARADWFLRAMQTVLSLSTQPPIGLVQLLAITHTSVIIPCTPTCTSGVLELLESILSLEYCWHPSIIAPLLESLGVLLVNLTVSDNSDDSALVSQFIECMTTKFPDGHSMLRGCWSEVKTKVSLYSRVVLGVPLSVGLAEN